MSLALTAVTFDCANALATAQFWSAVLDRPLDSARMPPNEFFASIGMDNPSASAHQFMFIQVPEPKSVKNRVHLDFNSDDPETEVARVIALGATRVHDKAEFAMTWTTLTDPEGNEFCIGHPH
jgi:predicted enzyme related to lactoylglutathione lyase